MRITQLLRKIRKAEEHRTHRFDDRDVIDAGEAVVKELQLGSGGAITFECENFGGLPVRVALVSWEEYHREQIGATDAATPIEDVGLLTPDERCDVETSVPGGDYLLHVQPSLSVPDGGVTTGEVSVAPEEEEPTGTVVRFEGRAKVSPYVETKRRMKNLVGRARESLDI